MPVLSSGGGVGETVDALFVLLFEGVKVDSLLFSEVELSQIFGEVNLSARKPQRKVEGILAPRKVRAVHCGELINERIQRPIQFVGLLSAPDR